MSCITDRVGEGCRLGTLELSTQCNRRSSEAREMLLVHDRLRLQGGQVEIRRDGTTRNGDNKSGQHQKPHQAGEGDRIQEDIRNT